MKDWTVQGLSVAIVHKGKVIYSKGYGYRDVEKKLPATAETLFAIGSCTELLSIQRNTQGETTINLKQSVTFSVLLKTESYALIP